MNKQKKILYFVIFFINIFGCSVTLISNDLSEQAFNSKFNKNVELSINLNQDIRDSDKMNFDVVKHLVSEAFKKSNLFDFVSIENENTNTFPENWKAYIKIDLHTNKELRWSDYLFFLTLGFFPTKKVNNIDVLVELENLQNKRTITNNLAQEIRYQSWLLAPVSLIQLLKNNNLEKEVSIYTQVLECLSLQQKSFSRF